MEETGRSHRGLRSDLAQSGQARPPDFTALLGEGPQVEIAEPDRPVAVIALGQRDRLFPHSLGPIARALPPFDAAIAAAAAHSMPARSLPPRAFLRIPTR